MKYFLSSLFLIFFWPQLTLWSQITLYPTEAFLKSTSDPYYDGEVDYGARAEHCWNGDHSQPNAILRLRCLYPNGPANQARLH